MNDEGQATDILDSVIRLARIVFFGILLVAVCQASNALVRIAAALEERN